MKLHFFHIIIVVVISLTSSADLAESNIDISAPAIKLPGLADISTAAFTLGFDDTSSNTYKVQWALNRKRTAQ